jgi:two-component system, chemotaxis family, sensor kinase CheA
MLLTASFTEYICIVNHEDNISIMSDNIFQKFRDKFFEEANMLLDRFENDILQLEKSPDEHELYESVFRAMHTIKGASAMYGFDHISAYTHLLENIFQNMRDGKIRFSKEISEISLLSIDHIHKLLDDEKLTNQDLRMKHEILMAQVNRIASIRIGEITSEHETIKTTDKIRKTWYIIINTSEQMFFRGINLQGICKELSALGEYKVTNVPAIRSDSSEGWGIVLVTDASLGDIRDVLMFIEDECRIIRIADGDALHSGMDSLFRSGQDPESVQNEPSITDLIEKNAAGRNAAAIDSDSDKQVFVRQKSKRISVETDKLDNLMYLVSQLITLNSRLNVANLENDYLRQRDYIEKLDILSKQFRDNALEIRLVPLRDITLRFQRLVRDLSKSMCKKIEFLAEGIDTELDKNTIDAIAEPLMHIIRNCADHGIEMPDVRKKLGKPETGIIKLSASYSGNHIIIKINDDGKGIELEKVRIKAIEKGILKKSDNPTDQELHKILFLPGFSTANEVSEVSGRGVGMDIVKKRLAELRGTISLDSKAGQGTSFNISLNQSISIADTLLFQVQESQFILPVAEILSCDEIDRKHINLKKHTSTIEYFNELIPLINLRDFFSLAGMYSENPKIITVRNGEQTMALLVDNIVGEHQAVLKPLHKTFDHENVISSVSQLGNGKIAFFIESGILYRQLAS